MKTKMKFYTQKGTVNIVLPNNKTILYIVAIHRLVISSRDNHDYYGNLMWGNIENKNDLNLGLYYDLLQ